MSQHPIDDLFANRLRDHGVKPERASWDELQRRMNEKEERKSPFIWWYASAASVAMLLLVSWWLWSGDETEKAGLTKNRIAQQTPKKVVPTKTQAVEPKTDELKAIEQPLIAYQKTVDSGKDIQTPVERQLPKTIKTIQQPVEESLIIEKPVITTSVQESQKPETVLAEVVSKQPERTLVVQITAPEIKSTELATANDPATAGFTDDNEDQPKKKRFRLGRVFRQINKLKAGESADWDEIGAQPGALLARASEKVQEGKEKLSNSYENLRYNAFKKNPNNK